jgi:peptidoglycan/LPS O-acetylase OafA/YrhL
MLDAFYGAFSPACLTLLGLWLVAVQMRSDEVRGSEELRRRAYAVALFFALPGLMSVIALIDTGNPLFWRVSFAVIALVGAAVLYPAHGLPGGRRVRNTADIVALLLYLAIAALALVGGTDEERTEAMLLTALIFVGFNVAWLFLFAPLEAKARHEPQGSPGAPTAR